MACSPFPGTLKLLSSPTGFIHPSANWLPPTTCRQCRLLNVLKVKAAKLPCFSGGGSGGSRGNSGGGGDDGRHSDEDEDDDEGAWKWQWIAVSLLAAGGDAFFRARPSLAIVLETSTRQTYGGEVAEKYAETLRQLCEQHDYEFYDSPYKLNIVGVRNPSNEPGAFDDHFSVVYSTSDEGGAPSGWVVSTYTASVDPGRAWLTLGWGGPGGTAILCPGQYVDAYEVGLHNGKYEALVQGRPVKVWRDHDKDGKLDFGDHGTFHDEGLYGVNIHHAGIKDTAEYHFLLTKYTDMVEKYSAGCQVIATVDDFSYFMDTVKMSVRKGNKPYFTYTLFQGEEAWDTVSAPLQQARESLQPYLT